MISFRSLHEHLQSLHSLPSDLLMSQEGLHFRDVHFAPLQCTLNMQCIPLTYLKILVSEDSFQPEGTTMDAASNSTAILIDFLSDNQHKAIQHIHIRLVVHHISCTLYEQKAIFPFIQSIKEDLQKARLKQASGRDPGWVCSYSMLVTNFGGLMALPTDPSYCLMYPNIYSDEVALQNQNHFNTVGCSPGICTCSCICCTLLQHADLTKAHRQKYNGSHLIVPRGTQFKTLLPEITMSHNHRGPLLDLHSRKPFSMVLVGDFSPEDKIFPCTPRDSLLFNGDELTELQKKRYQVPTYRKEKPPASISQKEKLPSSCTLGDMPSSTSKEWEPPKSNRRSPWASSPRVPTGSPSRKSLRCSKHSPLSKKQHDKHEKDSHSSSLKCKDKPRSDRSGKDKEGDKSLWKHPMSPPQRLSYTERAGKEPHLEEPSQTLSANSRATTEAFPGA